MSTPRPASEDPLKDIVLHHQRVDNWKDPSLTRDKLSNIFMGDQSHWLQNWPRPERNQFGQAGEQMTRIEIERKILRDAPIRQWGGTASTGKPYYKHLLTLVKLMFPKTDITDTLADVMMFICIALGAGKKLVNLVGSQNSSKTSGSVRFAYIAMFIQPDFTRFVVSSPFEKSADSGAWGEVEVLWEDLGEAWPGGTHTILFPNAIKYSDRRIEFIPDSPRTGRLELHNIKHTGKGKGQKARLGAGNVAQGIFGEIVDEINEVDSPAFLTRVVNSSSQSNYLCITSQNYKREDDNGGAVVEPSPDYEGCPDTISKLDVESDFFWHSVFDGITLRLDGHNSANILAGRVIYSYLFSEEDRVRIAKGGTESPAYMSQVRSFPIQGATANALLSKPRLSASRSNDLFFTVRGSLTGVSFCDPAFGGRDDAVYGYARFGKCTVTDATGVEVAQDLLIFSEPFYTLKLVRGAVFNDYWRKRYLAVGLTISDETEEADISFEDQIGCQCLELNKARGIPAANFGYDFSMRPDIVSSMNKMVGFQSVAFNYNMPPVGVPLINFKGKAAAQDFDSIELCKNRSTELGMLAADLFLSKAIRGGEFIPTAIAQTCRTHLMDANRKYVVEKKEEYKARWSNVSPDHRDVLFGICGMAAMRGFRSELKGANKSAGSSSIFHVLRSSPKFKARIAAKLPARTY